MKLVQQRINELADMRKRLEWTQSEDGSWEWFLDKEIRELTLSKNKNVRLAGRTLGLRTRLKSLVMSILTSQSPKRKEEIA